MKQLGLAVLTALLGGASLFANENEVQRPKKTTLNQTPQTASYNAPSFMDVRRGIYFTGNFTYWSASQENLELGVVSDLPSGLFSFDGTMITQNFDFAPGFQFGIGAATGYDNWNFYAEYTWFRNTDIVTASLDPNGVERLYPMWGSPSSTSPRYYYGREKWKLSMDFVDAELQRASYEGSALVVRPSLGLRGAFIRQFLKTDYLNESTRLTAHNVHITHTSHSWGVGPRLGVYSSWMLGQGVRLYGSGFGDVLFTKYTTISSDQQSTNSSGAVITGGIIDIEEMDVSYLRTHLDLEIGFGWGTYFYGNQYHLDISAGYGFQVFFGQNMFRGYSDDSSFNSSLPNGDLFVQGLTISAQFDF